MYALSYAKFGPPEVLTWADNWQRPSCSPTGVIIRCLAGGLNPKDALLRKNHFPRVLAREPLPRVSGLDIAGEVVEIGAKVQGLKPGDRVFGMTNQFCGGVHAEFAALEQNELAIIPEQLGLIDAAAMPLAAQTALQALRDLCQLQAGQTVLIVGASGGVGHFAVQIAKALGAEVHAVCSARNAKFVTELGADVVHDYVQTPAPQTPGEFDAVFDAFGSLSAAAFSAQLGKTGIFVSTIPKLVTLKDEALARIGLNKRSRLAIVQSKTKDLQQLCTWVETGQLKVQVEKVYPVAEAAAAHQQLETKRTRGKLVLTFSMTSA